MHWPNGATAGQVLAEVPVMHSGIRSHVADTETPAVDDRSQRSVGTLRTAHRFEGTGCGNTGISAANRSSLDTSGARNSSNTSGR